MTSAWFEETTKRDVVICDCHSHEPIIIHTEVQVGFYLVYTSARLYCILNLHDVAGSLHTQHIQQH
jgi:hypothetical protein